MNTFLWYKCSKRCIFSQNMYEYVVILMESYKNKNFVRMEFKLGMNLSYRNWS